MLGVVAAGGSGSRLSLVTKFLNKHLIPCDKETLMIDYPLRFMKMNDFEEVVVVTGSNHASQIVDYVGDGEKYGFKRIEYAFQPKPSGIADVLKRVSHKHVSESVVLILADNYFSDFKIPHFNENKAVAFEYDIKDISKAKSFGQIVDNGDIVEKPENPTHSRILTGLYIFPSDVFDVVESLKPSARNELEITDLLRIYLKQDRLQKVDVLGEWFDLGEWNSLKKFWKSKE